MGLENVEIGTKIAVYGQDHENPPKARTVRAITKTTVTDHTGTKWAISGYRWGAGGYRWGAANDILPVASRKMGRKT